MYPLNTQEELQALFDRGLECADIGDLYTAALLKQLDIIGIIRKSDKTSGQIVSEQIQNSKLPFTDLVTIRKFAEIAGIKFDERKFRNRREFREYFGKLIREKVRKENW